MSLFDNIKNQLAGLNGALSAGTTVSGNVVAINPVNNASASNGNLMGIYHAAPQLTPEEQTELNELYNEHHKATEEKKISFFKMLPAHIRQKRIDDLMVNEVDNKMNHAQVYTPQPQRMKDLIHKQQMAQYSNMAAGGLIGGRYAHATVPTYPSSYTYTDDNMEWSEDLKQLMKAHLDACADEALTGEQDGGR